MFERIRKALYKVTILSSTCRRILWTGGGKAQTFSDPINVKPADNQELIEFLKANDNKIVFLDTYIDVRVASGKNFRTFEKKSPDSDAVSSSSFRRLSLPLAYSGGNCVTAALYFCNDHVLRYSTENDLIRFEIRGFFRISRTLHGWTAFFKLTEVKIT